MRKKEVSLFIALFCIGIVTAQVNQKVIGLSGNAYVTGYPEGASVTEQGVQQWSDKRAEVKTYLYFSQPQTIGLNVRGTATGKASFFIELAGKKKRMRVGEGQFDKTAGRFRIPSPGYYAITMKGGEKSGPHYPDISSFAVQSSDTVMAWVHDFSDYWGRRGPSVHLNFPMPEDTIEWFYNEVTVPEGKDITGSYFMANGFGEGYFGMQRNSRKESRVLFSVWSPFDTQDPQLIPDSLKIRLLRRGEGVHIGEFGNEGSGGQSFLRYNWKAGNTYRFLTQIHPDGEGNTIYTAFFYAADEQRWRLIASFLRPRTHVWYTRAHSFLENFIPEQGYLTREVFFGNQWFRTSQGRWKEGTEARFSFDATARAGVRLDYGGGYDKGQNRFFLRNGGFFDERVAFGTPFTRTPENIPPAIDFEALGEL